MKAYYQDDAVTIYHGDCREIVPTLGKFDLLLTDPPYGLEDWNNRGNNAGGPFDSEKETASWDKMPDASLVEIIISVSAKCIIWGGNYLGDFLGRTKQMLVWDKGIRGMHFNDCEIAWCNGFKEASRVFNYSAARNNKKQHPTQKPLPLMTWCISLAGDVQTILDPFAGSCTTGRAAKDLGRKCVCIEKEEKYCEIGAKRMGQEVLNFNESKLT